MKIGIAGFGFVGQAVYNSIIDKKDVLIFDKYMEEHKETDLSETDIIFVCLPSLNDNEKQNITPFVEFFEKVRGYNGIIVIKSTVLYDNIKMYNKDFNIVFNPEFLNQISSYKDFSTQKLLILGGRIDYANIVLECFNTDFDVVVDEVEFCTQEEAIEFKYLRNIHGAYEVMFWNFVQETFNSDTRKLAQIYSKLPNGIMSNVGADGKMGFGGACFPKDLLAKHNSVPHELSSFLMRYNERIRLSD